MALSDSRQAGDFANEVRATSAMIEAGAETLQRSCDSLIMFEDYAASVAALLAEGKLRASVAYLCETEPLA